MMRVLFLLVAIFPNLLLSQYNTIVSSEIQVNENTEFISLAGKATNISEVNQDLRFVFSVITKNPEGTVLSNKKEEDKFSLDSFKSINHSETTINKSETNQVIVLSLVYNSDDVLLGKARWVFNDDNTPAPIVIEKADFQEIIYDTDFLKGLVTEDTRTKAGRDFYRIFYSKYDLSGINDPEIISVKEFFGGRRSTRIEVKLGNTLVSSFFLQPKEDYLKQMATFTLTNLVRAIQNKKSIDHQIESY
ncbi:CsgE family curli-type amyloid fiber assembly protein [Patiriisocius sp. Uisw_017]|jgi:hypothetical protein|uniref:CsgE family curli-type amyloid fiber assembly protein n=1 Tax=Patiriisocius sp. Uisw_017 TaxID=3230968 RepID=UPI0039EBE45A